MAQAIEPTLLAEAFDGSGAELGRSAGAVNLELTRSDDEVFVSGRVTATVGIPCALCLGAARVEVEQAVRMVYVREGADPGIDDEDPLADDDFGHHDGKFVDLTELVRELLILSLPISPRCSSACKGLCVTCGQNLNERHCGHEPISLQVSALGVELQKKLKNPES